MLCLMPSETEDGEKEDSTLDPKRNRPGINSGPTQVGTPNY
jgi:hypothetical protein